MAEETEEERRRREKSRGGDDAAAIDTPDIGEGGSTDDDYFDKRFLRGGTAPESESGGPAAFNPNNPNAVLWHAPQADAGGGGFDAQQQPTADTQGYGAQPPQQQQGGYAAHPSDWSRPLRDPRFSGPAPAGDSPQFAAEQAAVNQPIPGASPDEAADLYGRANAPMPGYQQTGPGQFSPTAGGPADPRLQQAPTGPMAMLQTGPGRHEMTPDTPQNRLISLNHQIATAQLSQSETRRAQDLSNAVQTVQDRVNDGTLSAADGQALRNQIQQRGEQLWARQGALPEMLMRQQFLQMQHQAAQQQAIASENAAQRAARIAANTHTYEDGTRLFIDDTGKPHIIPPHAPPVQRSNDMTPAQIATARQHIEAGVRRELHEYINQPPAGSGRPRAPRPVWHQDVAQGGSMEDQIHQQVNIRLRRHLDAVGQGHTLGGGGGGQTDQQRQAFSALMTQLGAGGGQAPAAPVAGSPSERIAAQRAENERRGIRPPPPPAWWENLFRR